METSLYRREVLRATTFRGLAADLAASTTAAVRDYCCSLRR